MTRSNTASARAPSAGFADFVAHAFDAIAGFAESFRRSHQIRRTYAELSALEDRTLADIGVSRGELAAVAVHCVDNPGVAYRKGTA